MDTPETRTAFIGRCTPCRGYPKDQLFPFQREARFPQSPASVCLKSLSPSIAAWEHSLLHPDLTLLGRLQPSPDLDPTWVSNLLDFVLPKPCL